MNRTDDEATHHEANERAAPDEPISRWIEYDYAFVRVVPRVDIGAFINIGVVLHARREGFLEARFLFNPERVAGIDPDFDHTMLICFAEAYRRAASGGIEAGPIGLLPPSERFHWLTAPRSAALQTSPVHPGICLDLQGAVERLLASAHVA